MTLASVSAEQESMVVALLVLGLEEDHCNLTDIRGLGVVTAREVKTTADFLVRQQLLEPISESLFEVRDVLRQRFARADEQATGEVTGEVTTGEVRRLLAVMAGEMKRAEIQQALGLRHEDHFRDAYLGPALEASVIEMTIPDKPRSSKQRYRLTERGRAVLQISDV
jgi:ATP-dependent DNA helicase RecG